MKKLVLAVLFLSLFVPVVKAELVIPKIYAEVFGISFLTPLYRVDANPFMYDWVNARSLIGLETKVLQYPNKDVSINGFKIPKNVLDIDFGGAGYGVPDASVNALFPYLGANLSITTAEVDSELIDYIGLWAGHDFRDKVTGRIFNAVGFKCSKKLW